LSGTYFSDGPPFSSFGDNYEIGYTIAYLCNPKKHVSAAELLLVYKFLLVWPTEIEKNNYKKPKLFYFRRPWWAIITQFSTDTTARESILCKIFWLFQAFWFYGCRNLPFPTKADDCRH